MLKWPGVQHLYFAHKPINKCAFLIFATMRLFFLGLLFPLLTHAQIPAGYYNSTQGKKGQALRHELHEIIKNHTVIPYSGLWSVFPQSDRKANGKVWDIYSFKPAGTQPYEYTFGTDQCGSYSSEGDCYNREHSWPQSWFNSVSGPDSDLFHIYPTDGKVNGQRANFPYGNVGSASWTSMNGSKLGNCINPGYSSTVFEPINEFKGDLARTYFYMTTRYLNEDASWSSSPAANKCELIAWQLNVLLQWHQQDPVSQKEKNRNDSIYRYQGNRNPFIDAPAFADSIWLSVTGLTERLNEINSAAIYPVPADKKFFIQKNTTTASDILIRNIQGQLVNSFTISGELNEIDCSEWKAGIYFIEVKNKNAIQTIKFIKL